MKMTLFEYIKKRNGVSIGSRKSLRNNLYRSFGAKNFATFWNYWNPIFGYYLGKFIFKPLKKVFPISVALLLTFLFCGLIHDAVTTFYRGKISLFFTSWFLVIGIGVLVTKGLKHNYSKQRWIVRVAINTSILSITYFLAVCISKILIGT